jgi:heptosyltransferase-3
VNGHTLSQTRIRSQREMDSVSKSSETHEVEPGVVDRIVAIRPGALGDTLLLFPTLGLLRRAFPAARVTLVAQRDVLPLARASGLADDISPYDDLGWSAIFADSPPASSPFRAILALSAVIAWLADPDLGIARNLRALGASRVATAPGRPEAGSREHVALFLARPLASLGIDIPESASALMAAMPPLAPPRDDEERTRVLWHQLGLAGNSTRVIALHPGSGGAAKRWPPERFAGLASSIREMGYAPLVVEGPQEGALVRRIAELTDGAAPIARNLAIGMAAALLRRCSAYVGNDSGMTHLAGLLGVPTLALFGPTDPIQWVPLGPHVRIVHAPGGHMTSLDIPVVREALAALLAG